MYWWQKWPLLPFPPKDPRRFSQQMRLMTLTWGADVTLFIVIFVKKKRLSHPLSHR